MTHIDIDRLATLARLDIDPQKAERYRENMQNLLKLIQTMDSVPTEGVEPLYHPLEITQRLREDAVTEIDQRDALQASAPKTEAHLYLVPKVIEVEE